MEINILAFGQIADIFGTHSWKWQDISDTDALREKLEGEYPKLKQLNYLVAIDKNITRTNTVIPDQATVALLPPYSGG